MIRLFSFMVLAIALVVFPQNMYAVPIVYTANLNGPSESPPNASPGIGFAEVDFDITLHTMHVHVTFSGLEAGTTASHIHSPTAIPGTGTANIATTVPTFPGFPLGVTSGTYDHLFDTLDLGTYNPAFDGATAALKEAALAASLAAGTAYLNVHSTTFPGGEIRGFLAVPEPATLLLLGSAFFGIWGARRKFKR